jgi:hypothetical protein
VDVVLHLEVRKPDPGSLGKRPVSGVLTWFCSEVSIEFFRLVPEAALVGDLRSFPAEYDAAEAGGFDVPNGVEEQRPGFATARCTAVDRDVGG